MIPLQPKLPKPDWDAETITRAVSKLLEAARLGDTTILHCFGQLLAHGGAPAAKEFFRKAMRIENAPDSTHRFFENYWIGLGDVLRRLVDDDDLVLDALHALTRPYEGGPLKLWRGQSMDELRKGVLGISWSSDPKSASTFGRWHPWNRKGGLVILEITAPPEAVISRLRSGNELFDRAIQEVVVDRRRLLDPPVVVQEFDEQHDVVSEAISDAKHHRARHDQTGQ